MAWVRPSVRGRGRRIVRSRALRIMANETGSFEATLLPLAGVAIPNDTATETVGAALHPFPRSLTFGQTDARRCTANEDWCYRLRRACARRRLHAAESFRITKA
jgi:hypothetical protein